MFFIPAIIARLQIVAGGILLQRKGNNFYWSMILNRKLIGANPDLVFYGYI
jgi:hypothetical protein